MAKKGGSSKPSAKAAAVSTWVVHWDARAVEEFNGYQDKRVRKSILTSVDFLRQLGDRLVAPHSKPLSGEKKLRELRPSGGQSIVRPLYVRLNDREFLILAVAPESQEDPAGFRAAIQRAKDRAKSDFGIDV